MDELSDILEQLDFQIHFLSGLVFLLAQDSGISDNSGIRILRRLDDVGELYV